MKRTDHMLCSNLVNCLLCLILVFDSWGKPMSRIAFGNLFWFGAYEECKKIEDARYCIARVPINQPVRNVLAQSKLPEDIHKIKKSLILRVHRYCRKCLSKSSFRVSRLPRLKFA